MLGNYARFLTDVPGDHDRARALVTGRCQAEAEVLLYLALIARLDGGAASQPLGCLKSVVTAGYGRISWSFAALFASVLPRIPEAERALFEAVGAAVLDPAKVTELERFPEWRALTALPPDHPLELCGG